MRSQTSVVNSGLREAIDIIEMGLLYCDSTGSELGLYLGKPDLWIGGPEQRNFDINSRYCRESRLYTFLLSHTRRLCCVSGSPM